MRWSKASTLLLVWSTVWLPGCGALTQEHRVAVLDPFWTRSEAAQVQLLQALREDPLALRWGSLSPSVVRHLEEAVRLDPAYHAAHYGLALCYCFQRRLEKALAEARRAVALEPDLPEGHLLLGGIYEMRGWLRRAVREYQRAVALRPTAVAHYQLGRAWRLLGNHDAALREYRRALALEELPVVRLEVALLLLQRGRPQEALADLRRALPEPLWPPDADPSFPALSEEERLTRLRDFLEQEGVVAEALRWCQRLPQRGDLAALRVRGYLHWLLGNWRAAIECLERVRGLRGAAFALHYELGVAYFALGRYEEAVRLLRRSNRYGAHLRLALYWRYVRRDYRRALAEIQRALRRRPGSPEALKQRRELLRMLGRGAASL